MSDIKKKILLLGVITTIGTTVLSCNNKNNDQNNTHYYEYQDDLSEDLDENKEISKEPEKKQKPDLNKQIEKPIVYATDNMEVREYTNYDYVSFNDVRRELENNQNLTHLYKEEIAKVINKLESKIPNIDLTCLYENLKKLKVEEISENKMRKKGSMNAYFSPGEHKIVLIKNHKYIKHIVHHETIHMLSELNLDTEKYLVCKSYGGKNDFGRSYREGLTEWLNIILFPNDEYSKSNVSSYPIEVNDIEIIRTILKQSKQQIAEEFVNYNSDMLYNNLADYLSFDELDKLFNLSDKQLKQSDIKTIKASEIKEKYDLLLTAMMVSKFGVINNYEIYDIAKLFKKSLNWYLNVQYVDDLGLTRNISDELMINIMETLYHYGMDINNDIKITSTREDQDEIQYCNKNNLCLGYKQVNDRYEFILIEEYQDDQNNYYYINPNYILDTDLSDYNVIYIRDLIDDLDSYEKISIEELSQAFYDNYLSQKKYQKIK